MNFNGNSATLDVTPHLSGIYGIEVDVTAQASDGMSIDRAAFLSFEAQPMDSQITIIYILIGVGAVLLTLAGILLVAWMWKKRSTSR